MKKFMKTAGWQIGAFVLAIGAAFATNAMKDTTFFATEMGYQQLNSDPLDCQDRIMCNIEGTELCTWKIGAVTHNLYGKVEVSPGVTKCIKPLFKISDSN